MKTRVMSGAIIFIIMALTIASRLLSPFIFDAVLIIVGIVGALEVVRANASGKRAINETISTSMIFVMYICMIHALVNRLTIVYLLIYLACIIILYFLLSILSILTNKEANKKEMLRNGYTDTFKKYIFVKSFRTIGVVLYPTLLFMLMIVLNNLESFYVLTLTAESTITSISVFVDFAIIATFVCATVTDTFAMLIGCKVGGPKLCPKTSPNKTISGALAGWLFGAIGVMAVYMLYTLNAGFVTLINTFNITWWPIVLFAFFAPIFVQIGDIIASAIKRKNNIKDYGNLIPGHGGVMDRVDGLIFANIITVIVAISICF